MIHALALLIPSSVNILHITVKSAKFLQEFSFVEVFTIIFHVSLDSGLFIISFICVILYFVNRLSKHVIVDYPLARLLQLLLLSLFCV